MKYYIDTEFQEGFYEPLFGKSRHFIDLISIGLVAEDGREYYAISKDFDLYSIWHSKDTWLKDNVLQPIHDELASRITAGEKYFHDSYDWFTYSALKFLIQRFGKTNKQIQKEIRAFIYAEAMLDYDGMCSSDYWINATIKQGLFKPEFYGYYADYDWVLFCSLFGRMIDLPKGFPMYCRDLKQIQDQISESINNDYSLKEDSEYPTQVGGHNALSDARWNAKLYEFLMKKRFKAAS